MPGRRGRDFWDGCGGVALGTAATGELALASAHADAALDLCTAWDIPLVAEWLRRQQAAHGF
jgi:hypothetical protein